MISDRSFSEFEQIFANCHVASENFVEICDVTLAELTPTIRQAALLIQLKYFFKQKKENMFLSMLPDIKNLLEI